MTLTGDKSAALDELYRRIARLDDVLFGNAEIPAGAPDNVVRTVTENSRTLKFGSSGFETE